MDKKRNEENDEFTSKSIQNSLKECQAIQRNDNEESKHVLKENIETVSGVSASKENRKCSSFSGKRSKIMQNKKPFDNFNFSSVFKTSADEALFEKKVPLKGSSEYSEIDRRSRSDFSRELKGKLSSPGVISEQNKCGSNDSALIPASFNKGTEISIHSLEISRLDSETYSNTSNSLPKSDLSPRNNESFKDMLGESKEMTDAHVSPDVASQGINIKEISNNVTRITATDENAAAGPSGIRTGKERFACALCDQEFARSCEFDIHYRTHTTENPFVCEVCNRRFTNKRSLTTHYKTHTDEKPFICDACGKGFARKDTLRLHYLTHNAEVRFVCDVCQKSFAFKSSLVSHCRTHTSEKHFVCDVCRREFFRKEHLDCHYRRHTNEKPYVCEVCTRGFCLKGDLRKHYTTHTGEKPYVCDVCNRGFSQRCNLSRHVYTHKGQKQYNCSVCGESFTCNSKLKRHCKEKHV